MAAQKRRKERRREEHLPVLGRGFALVRLWEDYLREQATSFAPTHGDTLHTKVEILPNAISYLNKNLL